MSFSHRFLFLCSIMISFSLLADDAPLLKAIRVMYEKDQKARFELIDSGDLISEDHIRKMEMVDLENLPRLKEMIHQFGWPGFQLVGEEGADKMWLLVQHCDRDLEFQKVCLQLLKEAVAKGDAPKKHLAYLMDRILVNEGRPQLYGTQVRCIESQAIPHPIENPDQLDDRRADMGLEPFDEYLSLLKRIYH